MPSRPPGLFHVLAQACARKWRRKMLSPRPSRPRHRAPNSRRAAPPPRRGAAAASAPPRARCRLSCRSQCRLTVAEMLTDCNTAPAPGAPIALPSDKPASHINAYASASPLQRASATNIGRHQTFNGGGRAAKASRTTSSGRHAAARRRLHGIQRLVRQLRCALLAASDVCARLQIPNSARSSSVARALFRSPAPP